MRYTNLIPHIHCSIALPIPLTRSTHANTRDTHRIKMSWLVFSRRSIADTHAMSHRGVGRSCGVLGEERRASAAEARRKAYSDPVSGCV